MPSVKIMVAAHKPYWMPADPLYLPMQVGAAGADAPIPGFQSDAEDDNISQDNPRYCELTALYWGWKNLDAAQADYIGLAHYRRHFRGTGERGTLTCAEAQALLERAPVVLPAKRRYFIETIESHYAHTFDPAHITALREAVGVVSPSLTAAFDARMAKRSAHMFNMMIMRRDVLDVYCTWLFAVLREAERHIDFADMDAFQQRCMGRLGERLLDVWMHGNDIPFVECPVVHMEKTNWVKKGAGFLLAKFFGKKYEQSM